MSIFIAVSLLPLDAGCLDDRPPFLDLRPVERAERLGRLLLARRNFRAEICETCAYRGIAKGIDRGSIELGDNGLGRVLGRPKSEPDRGEESRQAGFVRGRD